MHMNHFFNHGSVVHVYGYRSRRLLLGIGFSIFIVTEFWTYSVLAAVDNSPNTASQTAAQGNASNPNERSFYIQTYRIEGGEHLLSRLEIEEAVYPFLGPYRTNSDVEDAAGALQNAYRDKGYSLVSVEIAPGQHITNGRNVIFLQVNLNKVGRLRVVGSHYFSIDEIEREAPSVASGKVLNYNDFTKDNAVLNQFPDRHVSPVVRPGILPNTYDIDLNVKDSPPVHS